MPELNVRELPPEDYYATNLRTLVCRVVQQYGQILSPKETEITTRFFRLNHDALRLLARLAMRKGPLYRLDSLHYREVGDLPEAINELEEYEFVESSHSVSVVSDFDLLSMLSIRELLSSFNKIKTGRKKQIIDSICSLYSSTFVREQVEKNYPVIRLLISSELDIFLLLFFGNRHKTLSEFIVKDLAAIKYETYELSHRNRLFQNRSQVDLYLKLVAIREAVSTTSFFEQKLCKVRLLIDELKCGSDNPIIDRKRSRILNALGKGLERSGDLDLALAAYNNSNLAPSRERKIRILMRLGNLDRAFRIAERIQDAPYNELERRFALKVLGKRVLKRKIPVTKIPLDRRPTESIEQYALGILEQEKCVGWHLENQFPMGLFCLAYWSWIYANIPRAFTNPFQTGPLDLFWSDFFEARSNVCSDPLDSKASIRKLLGSIYDEKVGTVNQLFSWNNFTKEVLNQSVRCMSEKNIRELLSVVRSDINQFKTGFPDLVLFYESGRYEFVEVKGPGDRVQSNQHLWMEKLMTKNIPVRLVQFVHSSS